MTTNRALTKKEKVVVIQRGMARLPVMGTEAQWAFGVRLKTDFVEPPSWVSRVILMRFDIDPDKRGLNGKIDPLTASRILGSFYGLAEGAAIVLSAKKAAPTNPNAVQVNEEMLRKAVGNAAKPHLEIFDERAESVRRGLRGGTAEQYAAFAAGQNEVAQAIAAEEKEPGCMIDMTHGLLDFLWMFWPEIPPTGSVRRLHKWITDLGYLHCSEKLVEKVCRRAELRLSELGAEKRPPTN